MRENFPLQSFKWKIGFCVAKNFYSNKTSTTIELNFYDFLKIY